MPEPPFPEPEQLSRRVSQLIDAARSSVVRTTNQVLVSTYFLIGKLIVEEEQAGQNRAQYAKFILARLSERLMERYGKGYSVRYLQQMRKFYLLYAPAIAKSHFSQLPLEKIETSSLQPLPFRLSWSHYLLLCRLRNADERQFYEAEAVQNVWSLEDLQRQMDTALYERLALSRDKDGVAELARQGQVVNSPKDLIKDPYILEFLGLEQRPHYTESDLETAIIDQIERFLLELGKGFFFGGRQVRFIFDDEDFYVDLVFYNRLLRCFVLVDLKIGRLRHQDLGQMQMYVNYYDRHVKSEDENKTIGIIICKDKNDAVVEITLPEDNTQIFASQYQLILPSKEELKNLVR
jgi:predicted nuclease of restriction endonuclease-like (RecB) superfamily